MNKTLLSTLLILFALSTPGFAADRIHRIAVSEIPTPERLLSTPELTNTLIYSIIGEPLFQMGTKPGDLRDGILNVSQSKALDASFQKFKVCIMKGKQFSDGTDVTVDDLKEALTRIHASSPSTFGTLKRLRLEHDCISYELLTPHFDYFDALASPHAVVLKKQSLMSGYPISTGPFKFKSASKDLLVFVPNRESPGNLESIEIVLCKFGQCEDGSIDDWNYVYSYSEKVSAMISGFKKYPVFSSTVIALTINMKDSAVRQTLAGCLEPFREEFIAAMGETGDTEPQNTLIPSFYPGARAVTPHVTDPKICRKRNKNMQAINFIDYRSDRLERFSRLFKKHEHELPLKIIPAIIEADDLLSRLSSKEPVVSMLAFTSEGVSGPSFFASLGFFDGLYGAGKGIFYTSKEVETMISAAVEATTEKDRVEQLSRAHQEIIDEGIVIPVGLRKKWMLLPEDYLQVEFVSIYYRIPKFEKITVSSTTDE